MGHGAPVLLGCCRSWCGHVSDGCIAIDSRLADDLHHVDGKP